MGQGGFSGLSMASNFEETVAGRRYTTHCNYWLPVNTEEDSADEQIDRGISLQYIEKLWQAPFSNLEAF